MTILFVSNYFPPEVNAPANRLSEHARVWVQREREVEVLTAVPNFPEGRIYDGYRNRLTRETVDGIETLRVPMYVAPNQGTVRRTLSYLSFMISAAWFAGKVRRRPEVVVATSPQFFAALGGWQVARRFQVPFVLEIRDLWPDSIVAVGALPDSPLIRLFRRLERFVYRKADHIVVVTESFRDKLIADGVPPEKLSVVRNGVDLGSVQCPSSESLKTRRRELGLQDRFVASYVGTMGMAHRADVLLDAAERCVDENIVFVLAGAGAEVDRIRERGRDLSNVLVLPKLPRREALDIVALSDVSVVHLRRSPLFRTVIPSKMFEAMAMGTPVLLGVEGEAREILEEAGGGLAFEPEDPDALLRCIERLKANPELQIQLAAAGVRHVAQHFDRRVLAERYLEILDRVTHRWV